MRFCDRYVERRSRTHDQMVQAARSGVQNIAEGSKASCTSKKTEIKLTNVARASLEDLKLDYEDFLRQHKLPVLDINHPVLARFKERRCKTLEDVRRWVAEESALLTNTNRQNRGTSSDGLPPLSAPALVANAALSLLNLACFLLKRQIEKLATDFENKGGFTERLYRVRTVKRRG